MNAKAGCVIAVLAFLALSLQACSTTVEPLCAHRALYQAMSYSGLTGSPVRIAIGPSDLGTHAQAQAQRPDGEWEWLEQGDFGVGTGYKDRVPGFEVDHYVTIEGLLEILGYIVIKRIPMKSDTGILTRGDYSSSSTIYRDPLPDASWE
jgi:hypothetical protein